VKRPTGDIRHGTAPSFVAVADLNGDGKPDLVVVGSINAPNNVSVLLNTTTPGAAAPTFAPRAIFTAGRGPFSVAITDVNGDGKPDLVVANFNSASVSVLLNTTTPGAAAPTFASQVGFNTGQGARSVTVADLNGDGKPDLVVASGANTVSVLLNTTATGATTPTFASKVDFAAGMGSVSVAVGDLNGDGLPDIVVVNEGSNTVSVLLNTTAAGNPTPSFAMKGDFATGSNPVSVAVADLNGDGSPDIAVANRSSNSVSVLLNTTMAGAPAPSFALRTDFTTTANIGSVAAVDLNGDGKPDLVVASYAYNIVSVLLNTTAAGAAAPAFALKVDFHTVTYTGASSVAIGDLNGDGRPDVVLANPSANSVSVLLNTPETITNGTATGTITESDAPPSTPTLTSISPNSAMVGDPNTTITLNGMNFVASSTADFNGAALTTMFVSSTELMADIPAADLTMAGTAAVTVFTPGSGSGFGSGNGSGSGAGGSGFGGGGTSAPQTFTIDNPAPTLTRISPSSAQTGSPDTTITLTGTNFVNGSTAAEFNGAALSTTFVSATQLMAVVPAADLATAGASYAVTVVTAGPGGGTSAAQTFTVTKPAPVATTLVFLQQPGDGSVLQPIAQVGVQVLDQFGNPVTTGTVTIAVAGGSPGNLDAASTVVVKVDANGIAVFTDLILDVVGTDALTATYGDPIQATSANFTASAANLNLVLNSSQTTGNVPTVAAGDPFLLGASFVDKATIPLQARIAYGDGSVVTVPVSVLNQQGQFNAPHTYGGEGSFPVSVTILDSEGRVVGVGALPGVVQVFPAEFGSVNVLYGQPGQTVSQSVTDSATGITTTLTLTEAADDVPGGYLLVTALKNFVPPTTPGVVKFFTSYDVRQHNLPAEASVVVTVTFPDALPPLTTPQLFFLDTKTDPSNPTEKLFRGPPQFSGQSVTFAINPSSTPRLKDLNGTVLPVAATIPGQTATVAISPSLAALGLDATAALQTASFRTSTQLTLTLEPSQASQVSSTRSILRGDQVDGGGGDDSMSAAEVLFQFLIDKWDHLPKFLFFHDSSDAGRPSDSPSPPATAPAAPDASLAPSEPQESLSALDLFLRDPAPSFDWFTPTAPVSDAPEVGRRPRIEHRNPAAFAAASAAGLRLYVSGKEKRRKGGRSPAGKLK
jgi:hypothetical protein